MKLLIYAHSWAPAVGGVETITKTLADGLVEWSRKHNEEAIEVTLLTKTPAGSMDDSQLPYRVVRNASFMELIREIRRTDVIHLAGPTIFPLVIESLFRRPTIVEHHGYQASCPNGMLLLEPQKTQCPGHFMAKRYGKCLECNSRTMGWWRSLKTLLLTFPRRWLCRNVAVNVTITDHVSLRLDLPRSQTIYYGIENVDSRPTDSQESPEKPLRLAYLGRLVAEKGLPVLFRAVQQLDKEGFAFRLTVIGDGPERGNLESLAYELRISHRVTFTGEMRRQEVDQALRKTDVVVMPSLCEETAGLAAIEQMMSGGAVIASNIAGLAEVVGDAGLRFAPGSSDELCYCIKVCANDREKIKHLGSMARARALKLFSVGRFIMQHAVLYREVEKPSTAADIKDLTR
jgi:glycosyltransferase involved in cell wall biosynthesis